MKSTTIPTGREAENRVFGLHPCIIKLTILSACIAIPIVVLSMLSDPTAIWQNTGSHMLLEICGFLITGGITYCLWVQYCVSHERWMLLATIAFSGLMLGGLAHTLSLTTFDDLSVIALQYFFIWKIAAAGLLIAGALSMAVGSEQNYRRRGAYALSIAIVLVFCISAVIFGLEKSWPRIEYLVPSAMTAMAARLDAFHPADILYLAVLAAAVLAFARRYIRHEDVFSSGITAFLLFAAAAQSASFVVSTDYSMFWWVSHALWICGLSVLLVRLGSEFGELYAHAHARIEHLEAVHYLSTRLSNTLELSVVLRALVSDMADMLSARLASVMLADEDNGSLTTVASHGLPEEPLRPNRPQKMKGSGHAGFYSGHTVRAFNEKCVCVVDDVHTDVEFVPWKLLARRDGYTISVPLIYQETAIGVLNLFFEKHVPINNERIRLYQTLASAGAVAIANAQLYDKSLHGEPDSSPGHLHFRLAS